MFFLYLITVFLLSKRAIRFLEFHKLPLLAYPNQSNKGQKKTQT